MGNTTDTFTEESELLATAYEKEDGIFGVHKDRRAKWENRW